MSIAEYLPDSPVDLDSIVSSTQRDQALLIVSFLFAVCYCLIVGPFIIAKKIVFFFTRLFE